MHNDRERGFTVTEVSVVLLVMALVVAVIFGFLANSTEIAQQTELNSRMESDTQIVARQITSDLRSALAISSTSPTSGTCAPSSFASPYTGYSSCISLTIGRPTAAAAACPKTEVTYGVVGGVLYMDRLEYNASCTPGTPTTRKPLLRNITSPTIFSYFNRQGNDMLVSASSPPLRPTTMRLSLSTRYRATRSGVTTFSTIVALRNMR